MCSATVEAAFARLTTPGGTRYERPQDGRIIEFSFKPVSDGIRAVFRDITELRQREALAAAKEDVERTRKVMQTAFDNMGDGVALLDKDMRLQFMSQERIKSRQFPPELVQPGVPARDLMLFQARRGDFGPVANESRTSSARSSPAARCPHDDAGRHPLRHRPQGGRIIEFSFKPISDGGVLAVFRDITELAPARGGAGCSQGGRRAHARADADHPRQHE